ncbi:MAG: carbamoyltransferase HypF [Gemmataceae bacterium]
MSAPPANTPGDIIARRLRVAGHVQGVGFRPFVKRLADELGLGGHVANDSDGVFIAVEGAPLNVDAFSRRLTQEAPTSSLIEAMLAEPGQVENHARFEIAPSQTSGGACRVRIPPDRAMCAACRDEIHDRSDRRHGYHFTSCTVCGPRYTLLARMPYHRANTAMAEFPLCSDCKAEFESSTNRRHHAEVMACPWCGPHLWFEDLRTSVVREGEDAIRHAAEALNRGEIVALKGLGGFQLLTRADDSAAVSRLRLRKHRPSKPLAVMVRSLADASRHAPMGIVEQEVLSSDENPILLLSRRPDAPFAWEIAPHLDHVGFMLPTSPLHCMLLESVTFPVVATSCNRGEEPILAEEATPPDLAGLADVVLQHNRPILRRLDDSVVRIIDGIPSVIRLARGFAPLPLRNLERWIERLESRPERGVAALGGQQKNAIAFWTGAQAVLGPHVGDLEGSRTFAAWRHHLDEIAHLYGFTFHTLVVDGHPDYAATRWAEASGLPVEYVAHHHAHAVAAMVEHDLLHRQVLALAWDGTGFGSDDTLWGGECLRTTLTHFDRVATLRPIPLPGGEVAIRQPWRIAAALVHAAGGSVHQHLNADVSTKYIDATLQLLEHRVQCPSATSMGRLFDGVASIILGASEVSYEGEAAAWLESAADPKVDLDYPVALEATGGILCWDWRPTVRAIVADHESPSSVRAARFHNSIARWAQAVAKAYPEQDVVCSGGCFQNALLTERVRRALEAVGKRVHRPGLIPVNDGGLAAGQLAVALGRWAAKR